MSDQLAELSQLSALELGRRLAAGDLDPVEVTEHLLSRASAEPTAFIRLTADRARREAEASADRLRRGCPHGPLDGVPIAWKDLFDVAGTATTAGSATRTDLPPATHDAAGVANLHRAGMICLGKTNLTEFAYSGLGLNPHFGTPHNPYGVDSPRIPGGSSSGSAVAVARGVVPCAVGTDTSGSVRIPAAFTGLAGYKSTETRHDRQGMLPLSPTLDSVGLLARQVADIVAVDAALRGRPPVAHDAVAPAELTIVVPTGDLVDDCADAVRDRFEQAMRAVAAAGTAVVRRPVPALDDARRLMAEHGTIVAAEAYTVHRDLLRGERARLLDRRVRNRLNSAADIRAHDYHALLWARPKLSRALADDLADGILAFPTVGHTAPELAPLEADDDLFVEVNSRTLRSTMLASYLGMPGVALPTGRDTLGLPTSLLLSLPPGADDRLLSSATTIEHILNPT